MEATAATAVGKVVFNCLLSGARASVGADDSSKQVIRHNLPFLKEELAAMQSVLRDADNELNRHKVVPRSEVEIVRSLAYDADDCIQDATVQPEKPSRWHLPHTMRERERIAKEMKRLRAQIEDRGPRSSRYHITEHPNSRSATSAARSGDRARRAAASDQPEVNRMVQLINGEDNDLRVIAVWGTSGYLDQTSIVRAAYENPDVKEKFPCRAWVRVMQPFNPTEFVQSLVRQFRAAVGVEVLLEAEKTAQQLAQEFNRHVSKNAYLIVLNDLNTIEEWDRIKTCFPNNKNGSRIIVSTKQAEVATLSVGYGSAELTLKELAADQIIYAFYEKASQKRDGDGRTMALYGKSHLVGRAEVKKHIIKLITSEDSPLVIVWGTRGIGKTTLVRDVYDSKELSGTFHTRAYVTIIRPFNPNELLKSLVLQLIAGIAYKDKDMVDSPLLSGKTMTLQQLMYLLGTLLDGMRCLIVLDDILSEEEWHVIVTPFGGMRNSTKIIATTREWSIAMRSGDSRSRHRLEPLEKEDGLDLFTRKVFQDAVSLDQEYPQLVEQANLILNKCRGIPLAIVAIGDLLARRRKTESVWSQLNKHISAELEINPGSETIGTVFRICYDYLPYYLKSCVLYLPIFPQDYKVRRRRLILRWTAEGYLGEGRHKSAERIADAAFMELISLNMILPCQLSTDVGERVHSCQVHCLISEMAVSNSREEDLVFKLEDGCRKNTKRIVRHLVVSSNWQGGQSELESIVDMSRLRSVTVFGKWRPFFSLENMRLLRVLDLEDTSDLVDHHLKHIGKLLHLRYLSLRGCGDIYHLPDSLGDLRLLETLDVKGTKITKLPKSTTKLKKLQHIVAGSAGADNDGLYESMYGIVPKPMRNKLGRATVFSAGFCVACCAPHCMKQTMDMDGDVNRRDVCTACCCAMLPALAMRGSTGGVAVPREISKLKDLLTLGTVNVSGRRKTALQDIKGFSGLRKLGVTGINRGNGQELCSAITHLISLESLSVQSDGKHGLDGCLVDIASPPKKLQKLRLYGRLVRLPEWIQGLQNLVKLKLRASQLRDGYEAMHVLGTLPNLAILVLLENSFVGEDLHFIFPYDSFQRLLVLQLQSLDAVRTVEFHEGATPRLEVLKFGLSSDGECRFVGLQDLPSLREVVLSNLGRGQQEYMVADVREQLAANPNRPVLRVGN